MSVIGGRDISEDRHRLSKCKTIVATLGRLLHLINNRVISIKQIELVVLDEADKLITNDFRSNIDKLFKMFPSNPQIIASSATYANGLDKLLLTYMRNPVAVSASNEKPILIGIKQFVHVVRETAESSNEATTPIIKMMMRKVEATEHILKNISFKQCILFSNSQMRAESFFSYLTGKGWNVDLIIGSHEQKLRTSTFQKFCKFESRILIASDVLARGIDVENVNLVLNLDVPTDSSTYLHRIGRCGRFGTYGIAITLVTDNVEMNTLQTMLRNIGANAINVSLLPTDMELDNSRMWDFSNQQSDASIFDEINELSKGEITSDNNSHESESNATNSKPNGNNTENQNAELLEISKLMLENKPHSSVQVELDLFSDYSNQDRTLDAEIGSTNADSSNEVTYQDHRKIEEIIAIPEATVCYDFLQAVKSLKICQLSDNFSENVIDSKTKSKCETEVKPDEDIHIKTITNKNVVRKRIIGRKQKSPVFYPIGQHYWHNIFWHQYNQINQYCWGMQNNLPRK